MIELSAHDVHLDYGDNPVLKGVSMQLDKGEVVSLLGPSGSGKTTLLRAIAGLENPKSGRIAVGDKSIYDSGKHIDVPAEARNLGLVFQSYALWPHKTVADNVAYPLTLRKVGKADIAKRVADVLRQLGLGHLGERYPHQLSGGQQQRVAIARALVYNPPVILLDEPLSNLDAKLREEARAFLRELIVRLGLSALMVTHDQGEAMAISDRILLLNNGKIEQQGTPQSMYGSPASLFVAEFMGSNNRLAGKVAEVRGDMARIEGDGWSLWGKAGSSLAAGSSAVAVIRLEQVRWADATGGTTAGATDNGLPVQLATSMYLGDRWECVCHLGTTHATSQPDPLAVRIRAFSEGSKPPGAYRLVFPPEQLWVFPA